MSFCRSNVVNALLALAFLAPGRLYPREPGDAVSWVPFPAQKKAEKNPRWGAFLTDLEAHLPAEYGKEYQADDLLVHAHETSHAIHAHIRNLYAARDHRVGCFYAGSDRAAV